MGPETGVRNADTHDQRAYEFFRSIGSPSRVVAPMVDQSELPFRLLCRRYGGMLCYTPMYNSRCFATSSTYRESNFDPHPEDRPLIVQFCGNDPETLLAAAKFVEGSCDAVDINLVGFLFFTSKSNHSVLIIYQRLEVVLTAAAFELFAVTYFLFPACCRSRLYTTNYTASATCHFLNTNHGVHLHQVLK
ncbi:unnamed protein product [Choristocarpus tenellus]